MFLWIGNWLKKKQNRNEPETSQWREAESDICQQSVLIKKEQFVFFSLLEHRVNNMVNFAHEANLWVGKSNTDYKVLLKDLTRLEEEWAIKRQVHASHIH